MGNMIEVFPAYLYLLHTLLTGNRIWRWRLCAVGIVNKTMIEQYGLTGVMIRGSGIKKDIRLIS